MKVSLEFEIGNTTCAASTGKFCRFLRVSRLDLTYACALFLDKKDGANTTLNDRDGSLARCPDCLAAFPPKEVEG